MKTPKPPSRVSSSLTTSSARAAARALLFAGICCPAALARAQVAVVAEGEDAAKLRQHIVKQAPSGVTVLDPRSFGDTLAKNGLGDELGVRINQASARGDFVQQVAAAARDARASFVILARALPNREVVWLLGVDAQAGSIELDREVALPVKERPKPKKGKRKGSGGGGLDWSQVDAVLDSLYAKVGAGTTAGTTATPAGSADWGTPDWASGGTTATPASAKLPDKDSADAPATETSKPERRRRDSGVATAFLLVRPTYTVSGRQFAYTGRATGNLRPYEALGVSQLGIDAELYPAAIPQVAVAENIGLRVGYRQALGLKSAPKDNESATLTTSWRELDADLRFRLVLDPALLSLFVGYGTLAFTFEVPATSPLADQVPDLTYSFVRAGLDLRLDAGPIAVLVSGAYRLVLTTGRLGDDYFPNEKAMGFDASLGAAYPVVSRLEVVGLLYYTRFGHTLNADAGATYIAESAADSFYGLRLAAQLYF